jgi:hypothetical protein
MTEKYETFATAVGEDTLLTLYQNDGFLDPKRAVLTNMKTTSDFRMMKEGAAKLLHPNENHKADTINLYTIKGVFISDSQCIHDELELIVAVGGHECVMLKPFEVTLYHNDGTMSPQRARKCTVTQCPFDELKNRMVRKLGLQNGNVQLYAIDGLPLLNIKSIQEGMEIIVARNGEEVATRGFALTLFRNDGLKSAETAKLCLVRHSNFGTVKEDMAKCLYPGSVAPMVADNINLFTMRGVPVEGVHFLTEGMDVIVAVNETVAKFFIPVTLYHNDGLALGARARCCMVPAGDFNRMKASMAQCLQPSVNDMLGQDQAAAIQLFTITGAPIERAEFVSGGMQIIVALNHVGLIPLILPQPGCCIVM